ncbi:MAG TPA: 4'-phosphopantetheinyl transferase superfamily protein [Vicinamibacterales bacterium]|nr:4'-phosphopantetheinyl transferase superfamily protein [Vicinamibacterales bacterium]
MPTHDVHVWFRATDALDAAAIAAAAAVLSDEERERYRRFHFARDARDYAAAHALLRQTLSLGGDRMPTEWRFEKTHAGKPRLIGDRTDRASFSLSHTLGMVACAVTSGAEVGVDVECVDRDVDADGIAARFFAPAEAAQLMDVKGEARRDRFFDFWTLKEALVKALGRGMAVSLNSLAFTVCAGGDIRLDAPDVDPGAWQFALFAPSPRHRLAVAAARMQSSPARIIFRSLECLG